MQFGRMVFKVQSHAVIVLSVSMQSPYEVFAEKVDMAVGTADFFGLGVEQG
jgi:hypothetical protein